MIRRTAASLLLAAVAVTGIACEEPTAVPTSIELANATGHEITRACTALRRVRFDYWSLDGVEIGGRLLEVAAAIHTDNPGPQRTMEYCTTAR